MVQARKVVEPFGEVNTHPVLGGRIRVTATILMEPKKAGARTGIALDGSSSMMKEYGLFGNANVVSVIAQRISAYLARRIDANGGTTCIYWATGWAGDQIEVVGDFTAAQAEEHEFGPPKDFGKATNLLPAVKYFVERFPDAPWGFYVFVTDGELQDLAPLRTYSIQLARDIAAGKRQPLKFVLIGVGPEVNEQQLAELDDLRTGTNVDLWDHKIAREMRVLQEIFAEVVDKNTRVAEKGRVLDPQGNVAADYTTAGVPAFLEFMLPPDSEYFVLELNDRQIRQEIPKPTIPLPPLNPIPRISSRRAAPPTAPQRKGCLSLLAAILAFFVAGHWGE